MTKTKSSMPELKSSSPDGMDEAGPYDVSAVLPTFNNSDEIREDLYHLCTILNAKNEAIVGCAMHILKKMEGAFQYEGDPFIFPQPVHVAFAIWDALSLRGYHRSPRTIGKCCGVDPKKILHLETQLLKNKFYTQGATMKSYYFRPPSMYCETTCDILCIPIDVTLIIKAVVTRYEARFEFYPPEDVLAAAILLVCDQFRKLNVTTPKLIKMKHEILHLDFQFIKLQFDVICNKTIKNMQKIMQHFIIEPKNDKLYIKFM